MRPLKEAVLRLLAHQRVRFYVYTFSCAALIVLTAWVARGFLATLPSIDKLEEYKPSLVTHVYDRDEKLVAQLFTERRALLELKDIPTCMKDGVIASEDDQFYHHYGFSPRGILRAAFTNFVSRRVTQGASTITQQLAKQVFLTPEKKLRRKIKELLLAIQMERNFSKDELLQMYLNQIYFGIGAYGVQAAARVYFGKALGAGDTLTLAECALLAGVIQRPGSYSPFDHPERALARRATVLHRMAEEGFVTEQQLKDALAEPLPEKRPNLVGNEAPYFVEYVRQILEPKYGVQRFWKGGLEIHTTLDMDMQNAAQVVMSTALAHFDLVSVNERKARLRAIGEDPDVPITTDTYKIQGAFVGLEVRTGAVRVLVGGRDFESSKFNRATQARRQPGSTFKPFVYTAGLMNGFTPSSIVEDAPLSYYFDGRDWRLYEGTTDQFILDIATQPFVTHPDFKIWVPSNWSGRHEGEMTVRRALEKSRNIVSIYLIERVGPSQVIEIARKAGITAPLSRVLSLGLGTSVISPLELAQAFSTFAHGGIYVQAHAVTKVLDKAGRVLESHVPESHAALDPVYTYVATNMMTGVVKRGTGYRAAKLNRPLAGKTGTTQDNRDLWFAGFSPDIVGVAWMGYDDSESLGGRDWTGGGTVVPWWTDIMEQIFEEYPKSDFPVPEGVEFRKVDLESGLLALPDCPRKIVEAYVAGTAPKTFCRVDHYREKLEEERRKKEEEAQKLEEAAAAEAASQSAAPVIDELDGGGEQP